MRDAIGPQRPQFGGKDRDERRHCAIRRANSRGARRRAMGADGGERLVERLIRVSPQFAAWWPRREVAEPLARRKRLGHPRMGRMEFEYSSFSVSDRPDMKLIFFTPVADDGTDRKLARLLA